MASVQQNLSISQICSTEKLFGNGLQLVKLYAVGA